MSDLVKKLRGIRQSTAQAAGNMSDWTLHDIECIDTADEAADRIEELEVALARLARWVPFISDAWKEESARR